jgi:hypothetical protein
MQMQSRELKQKLYSIATAACLWFVLAQNLKDRVETQLMDAALLGLNTTHHKL